MTLSWLLAAAAVLLAGPARARTPGGRAAGGGRAVRRELSPRVLEMAAGAATGCCCLVLLGPGRGAIVAVGAVPTVVAGLRWLRARPPRGRPEPTLPLTLDLIAVALRSGQPLDRAVLAAAPAAGTLAAELTRVARLLQLGADPADAWAPLARHPALEPVAALARRSAASGIRLASGFDTLATELRAQERERGSARAHRAGVLAAAPLGLCFLPAFVCLGIVPALIGLATHLLR